MQERRKKSRTAGQSGVRVLLWLQGSAGNWRKIPADLQDRGEFGAGLEVAEALQEGTQLLLEGGGLSSPDGGRARGAVIWCRSAKAGHFRVGVALESAQAETGPSGEGFEDHYETLEVNPVASIDTIHKIYRLLAQRLHPDNPETGNEEAFKRLSRAYRVLADPETRAAFDIVRQRMSGRRMRIFDTESATPGLEQEQAKRRALLAVLYMQRMRNPEGSGMTIPEMERTLEIPREHLEFPLWFMKEQGWVQRGDGGRHVITAKGVDYAETTGAWRIAGRSEDRLLTASRS